MNLPKDQALAATLIALGLGALGALSLGSADFAFQWQPVPPDAPARSALALAAGGLEVLAAVLLAPARTRALGAWLAAVVLLGWVALHVPSVVQRPTSVADWLGVAETAAMASAALMFAATWSGVSGAPAIVRGATWAFGLAAIVFGVSHFVYAGFTATMIPAWLPQRLALAYFTGAAHALAGLAILVGPLRVLAARLEAVMMAVFVALVHVPMVLAKPADRMAWTMLAVAVLLTGSSTMVGAIRARRTAR